jgi:signal transduction histidine kinase
MPSGGRLSLETEEVGGRCRLWVRDNGPGLPAEIQDHLFEPFLTTKEFGHLGLGLALAADLARVMDGTVTVSSCMGAGTTVLFSFPALKAADLELPETQSPSESDATTSTFRYPAKPALNHVSTA